MARPPHRRLRRRHPPSTPRRPLPLPRLRHRAPPRAAARRDRHRPLRRLVGLPGTAAPTAPGDRARDEPAEQEPPGAPPALAGGRQARDADLPRGQGQRLPQGLRAGRRGGRLAVRAGRTGRPRRHTPSDGRERAAVRPPGEGHPRAADAGPVATAGGGAGPGGAGGRPGARHRTPHRPRMLGSVGRPCVVPSHGRGGKRTDRGGA